MRKLSGLKDLVKPHLSSSAAWSTSSLSLCPQLSGENFPWFWHLQYSGASYWVSPSQLYAVVFQQLLEGSPTLPHISLPPRVWETVLPNPMAPSSLHLFVPVQSVPCVHCHKALLLAWSRVWFAWIAAASVSLYWPWGAIPLDGSFWGTGNPFSGLVSLALSFRMQLYFQKMEPLMVWILCSRFCSSCPGEGNQVVFNCLVSLSVADILHLSVLSLSRILKLYISLLTKLHTFLKSFCSTFFLLSLWIWRRAVNRNHYTTWMWRGLETFSINQIRLVSLYSASRKFSGHGRT